MIKITEANVQSTRMNPMGAMPDMSGRWSGEAKIAVDLAGIGIIRGYESMHVHLFASDNVPMEHSTHQ